MDSQNQYYWVQDRFNLHQIAGAISQNIKYLLHQQQKSTDSLINCNKRRKNINKKAIVVLRNIYNDLVFIIALIVLQISRLSEGSTGLIFATSSVIYQMKMWGL